MRQLKITEMVPSRVVREHQPGLLPGSGVSSTPSPAASKPSASTEGHYHHHHGGASSLPVTPLPPRTSRFEIDIAGSSPLSQLFDSSPPTAAAPIPATPESYYRSSQSHMASEDDDNDAYLVPESPPQLALGNLSARQLSLGSCNGAPTPKEPALAKGDSPQNAIDIPSGDDSDCEITMVRPSPNKKNQRGGAAPPYGANMSKPSNSKAEPLRRLAQPRRKHSRPSIKDQNLPVTGPSTLPSSSDGAAPEDPWPPTPAQRRPSIKASVLRQIARQLAEDDSDCVLEKVQPSPKRRLPSQPQASPAKRRRVDNSCDGHGTADYTDADSMDETDDSNLRPIPFALAGKKSTQGTLVSKVHAPTSTPTYSESDVDGEDTKYETPCKARDTLRKTMKQFDGRPVAKSKAATRPVPVVSTTKVEGSPVIDLTDLNSSSDSEMSSDEDMPPKPVAQDWPHTAYRPAGHANAGIAARDAVAKSIKREISPQLTDVSHEQEFVTTRESPFADTIGAVTGNQADAEMPCTPNIKLERSAHSFSSSPLNYPSSNEDQQSTQSSPELPAPRPVESSPYQFTPPTSSFTSDPSDPPPLDSGGNVGGTVGSTVDGTDPGWSSPIDYQSNSDEVPEGELNARLAATRSPRPMNKPAPSKRPSRYWAVHDSESSGDDHGAEPPPRDVYHRNPIPLDVYNFPRIGSGGYEPRSPPLFRPPYVLKPVYKGEKLLQMHKMGQSGRFKPHHRNTLIGLKGILKHPQPASGQVKKDVGFPPETPKTLMEQLRANNWPRLFTKEKKPLDQIVEEQMAKAKNGM